MDMLQLHAEALQSTATAYHEFLLRYRASHSVVYGFVEGKEDPMFYRGLIEQALPAGWEVELIPSGNRDNVLSSLAEFDWTKYSKKRICFFVDRDLTEFVGTKNQAIENLYITDNYSIENEAMTFGTYRRILEEVFNIGGLKPADVEKLKDIFDKNLSLFQKCLHPIMAQIIIWQRAGLRPTLNDIDIRPLFEFTEGLAKISPAFLASNSRAAHAAGCVGLAPSPEGDRLAVESEFEEKQGLTRFIRGKYTLWFLVESVTKAHQSVHKLFPAFTAPPKVRISLGQKNAMVVVAPRVRCPQSLKEFFSSGFVAFCSPRTEVSAAVPWRERMARWAAALFSRLA